MFFPSISQTRSNLYCRFLTLRVIRPVPNSYSHLFYSLSAMSECEELLKSLQYKDFSEIRYNVPKNTLQTTVKKGKVLDYAKEIISIAEQSLKSQGSGEERFLDAIKQYTFDSMTPADVILKNWHGAWNRNMKKLIKKITGR